MSVPDAAIDATENIGWIKKTGPIHIFKFMGDMNRRVFQNGQVNGSTAVLEKVVAAMPRVVGVEGATIPNADIHARRCFGYGIQEAYGTAVDEEQVARLG